MDSPTGVFPIGKVEHHLEQQPIFIVYRPPKTSVFVPNSGVPAWENSLKTLSSSRHLNGR